MNDTPAKKTSDNEISVPLSPGEVVDKITILQIKSERIEDATKRANVMTELALLSETWQQSNYDIEQVAGHTAALKKINEQLWDIEDDIRKKESEQNFDQAFIQLARDVYFTNDKRAELKRQINVQLGSLLIEEKSYEDYQ